MEAMIVIKVINDPTSNIITPASNSTSFFSTIVLDKSINLMSEDINTYNNDIIYEYLILNNW